jgi:hypothetical protein
MRTFANYDDSAGVMYIITPEDFPKKERSERAVHHLVQPYWSGNPTAIVFNALGSRSLQR